MLSSFKSYLIQSINLEELGTERALESLIYIEMKQTLELISFSDAGSMFVRDAKACSLAGPLQSFSELISGRVPE